MRELWKVLLAYFVILLPLLMYFEPSLIFHSNRYPAGDWTPAGLKFEDAWFKSADGTQLYGWYMPCDHPLAVVLFCHGNAGNIAYRGEILRHLHEDVHVTVLAFDYRSYGRSQGKPTGAGIMADARAARAWLAQRAGVDPAQIVLMGESLGGAVAVDLAAHDGARALVLTITFNSLVDVASYHYPWLPVRLLMRTRMDSAKIIGQYHGPLLQSHSKNDTVVPYQFGRRLFAAANEPKQFITFEGIDHNDPPPADYYVTLRKFLESLPR